MVTLVVRTPGDPASLAGPIQRIIEEIDPSQPIRTIQPLTDLLAESIAQERFFTLLFAMFGGLALALSAERRHRSSALQRLDPIISTYLGCSNPIL